MDDQKSDKEPDEPLCKNADMLLQRHSIPFPSVKSNSIHRKPSEPMVPKKPRNVSSLRISSVRPRIGDPSPKRSFIKRMYHRVVHPEDSHTINNTPASVDPVSDMSESPEMSPSYTSSHKTDARVAKLLDPKTDGLRTVVFGDDAGEPTVSARTASEIARSIRNIDISFDEPDGGWPSSNNYIIPPYYFNEEKMKGKLLDIDFGFTIIDSIRNLRTLTLYQLEYLQSLSNEKLIEIIHEYDHVMKTYVQSLLQDN